MGIYIYVAEIRLHLIQLLYSPKPFNLKFQLSLIVFHIDLLYQMHSFARSISQIKHKINGINKRMFIPYSRSFTRHVFNETLRVGCFPIVCIRNIYTFIVTKMRRKLKIPFLMFSFSRFLEQKKRKKWRKQYQPYPLSMAPLYKPS